MVGLRCCNNAGVILAVLMSGLTSASPATALQAPTVLTLNDALRIAHESNPEFLRTSNDLDVAASSVRSAWGAFLPSLSAGMSFGGSRSTTTVGQDELGVPITSDRPVTYQSSNASQRVGADITLFDGGINMRNLQAQRATYASIEAQVDVQRIALEARVSREYYQLVRALRLIELEQSLLASARERQDRTEQLLRLAARNREDVLGARADVAQAEANLQRARGESDKARLTLATTLGMDPSAAIPVDTVLPTVFNPADLDADALVAEALATSPVVRQREAALRAARHTASAANRRRLPTISADAGYSRGASSQGYSAFGDFNPDDRTGFSFGLSFSLPLFSRFQTSQSIAQAEAAAVDAGYDLNSARLTVERDVRSAVIDLSNAHQTLLLAQQAVEYNRERQRYALERYRLGGIDFITLQQVIDRTAQSERQALDALFGFINARIALEERLGHRLEN